MRPLVKLILVLMSLGVLSCASTSSNVPVKADYDQSQNFSGYKTFTWAKTPPIIVESDYHVDAEVESAISMAIRSTLSARGFTFVEDENDADIAVSYTVGARDMIDMSSYSKPYTENKAHWYWGLQNFKIPTFKDPNSISLPKAQTYPEGNLAIDVFDVKEKRPVWHSSIAKKLSKRELGARGAGSQTAVSTLLADFPPKD